VAWHIVSKAASGDRRHRAWVNERVDGPPIDRSVLPQYAEALVPFVEEEQPAPSETPAGEPDELELKVDIARAAILVERMLWKYVRELLVAEHGESDSEWWAQGIKKPTRIKCTQRMEDCSHREHPYAYTDLSDFHDILKDRWVLFQKDFQQLSPGYGGRPEFLEDLRRFNNLRHLVHGCRQVVPTEDDLDFVRQFASAIQEFTGSL
jgi:hypothetical protein